MSTQIRTILFTGLLFLGLATGAQAQDKYEFASVTQWGASILQVSIEGKPLEKLPLGKEADGNADHRKLFELVSKMQDEGWEVFNSHESGYGNAAIFSFVLRRKKA
ncbi:MAG: hypothetical protein K9J06_11415 [Flavobacteriales bacterium]|nr:hypothetical protein [Flavobacteriales bacterium]